MRRNTNHHETLVALLTAAERKVPVTITALKEEKDDAGRKTGKLVETIRTIEIYDAWVSNAGDILVTGMDRESKESRSFRLDRITHYTVHRSSKFVLTSEIEDAPQVESITDDMSEMGPADVTELLIDRLTARADAADTHGLADVADLLWEAAANLEWALTA